MYTLYLVQFGEVTEATPETEPVENEGVLVAAHTPEEAMVLARRYDRGEIQPDNLAGPACGYVSDVTLFCLRPAGE